MRSDGSKSEQQKTACAYIRVSTDRQDELSPDAQRRLILEYAKKNNICILEQYIFMENGISGKKADMRPAFMNMISLAKSNDPPFDIILVWKFSRFARNQEESIVYKSLLKKNDVDVISISEPLIEGPFGSLIERIIEWMDEYYSIRLSGEVIRGMTEKAMRGGYQSKPPLGYQTNKETKIPCIIEKEAELIQRIYKEYALNGKSFLEIAREMNGLGYRTQRGKTFEQRAIKYILENPFYTGKVRWNRQNHNDHVIKDKSEWIISMGIHERIIEEELFHLVQEQILARTRPYKSRSVSSVNHWLVGTLKCSACNSSLLACRRGKQDGPFYFQCGAYNRGSCEVSHLVISSKLEVGVIEAFEKIFDSLGKTRYEIKPGVDMDFSHDIELLKQQLHKLSEKETRVKLAYLDGIDNEEEYNQNKKKLKELGLTIQAQINDLQIQALTHLTHTSIKQVYSIYDIIKDENNSKLIRGNALRSVVSRIIYDRATDTLKVYFLYPNEIGWS